MADNNTKTVSLTDLKESGELEEGVVYFEHQDSDTGKVELTKMEAAKGKDSPAIVDGALYCLLNGSFPSPYTGRTEEYKMLINGLPIDGIGGGSGGGSGVETLVVTGEAGGDPTNPGFTVTNTSMTFDELNDAILDGKPVLCFLYAAMGGSPGFNHHEPIILSHVIGPIAPDDQAPALLEIHGVSSATYRNIGSADTGYKTIISYVELSWDRSDELPTVEMNTYKVVSAH